MRSSVRGLYRSGRICDFSIQIKMPVRTPVAACDCDKGVVGLTVVGVAVWLEDEDEEELDADDEALQYTK